MSILDAKQIQLKDLDKVEHRTVQRDEAAHWINTEIVEKGRWPMKVNHIVDESRWSRSHIRPVLDDYFKPARGESEANSESESVDEPENGFEVVIRFPVDLDENERGVYARGYLDCYLG